MTETTAKVLKKLGVKVGHVVRGEDTMDEISVTGRTKVREFNTRQMKTSFIQPEDFGMKRRKIDEIKGGTKKQNAVIILEILRGSRGAKRDVAVLFKSNKCYDKNLYERMHNEFLRFDDETKVGAGLQRSGDSGIHH